MPAVLGLAESLTFLQQQGLEQVQRHARELTAQLLDGFSAIDGVTVYGPGTPRSSWGLSASVLRVWIPGKRR